MLPREKSEGKLKLLKLGGMVQPGLGLLLNLVVPCSGSTIPATKPCSMTHMGPSALPLSTTGLS